MKLSDLDGFSKITIQCHDNPDPDAIASGWALTKYFLSKGCNARFIYSGRFKIQKSNLQLMLENLKIPIEYCKEYACDEDELLLTTDCQYGQGNVSTSVSANVAVIDHHQGNLEKTYRRSNEPYKIETEYFPTIHCERTGEVIELIDRAKSCYATGGSLVLAKQLNKIVKIFTSWDHEHYYLGNPGDFIVCREDDLHDIYIIKKDIFLKTYQQAE